MAKIEIEGSVVKQAMLGKSTAINAMFQPFLSEDETIISAEYLGSYGAFFTTKSFVCVSDKKVASIQYGPFGKIVYSDAFLEEVNSGIIYQPSVFVLYLVGFLLCCTLIGILFLNAWVRFYYIFNKSGLVWIVREGVNIYAFANRSKMNRVNAIWRKASFLRGQRKQYMK